jgi:plasmid stabilization system protein ParE
MLPPHFTVQFTAKARKDIRAIAEYIAIDSPSNAEDFVLWMEEEIMSLDRFPLRCPVALESESWGLEVRLLLVGSYRVLFTIRGVAVIVLRVRHGARKSSTSFDD